MAGQRDVVEIEEEQYTEDELKAVDEFLSKIHGKKSEQNGETTDNETAIKFLMARKFDVDRAVELYRSYLVVCDKFDLKFLDPFQDQISIELLSGKFTVLAGKDFTGARVCLFTEKLHFPKKTTHQAVLKSLIFQLNELISCTDAQRNGIVLIYDMTKAAYRNFDYDLCMKTLRFLKGSFPARLKHIYILSAPFWFRASLAILSNFVGEKITNRVEILRKSRDLSSRIPTATLPLHLGGACEHDHDLWLNQCITSYLRASETKVPINSTIGRNLHKSKSFADRLQEAAEEQEKEDRKISRDDKLSIENFVRHVDSIGKRGICAEFDRLSTISPHGSFSASSHRFNQSKNRYRDVLCYDHSRVKLKIVDGDEFTDYINASFVDGYDRPNAYICAQGPLKNTVFDFWRMILEQRPSVIIMLAKCYERGREKCYSYWPEDGKAVTFSSVTVRCLGVTKSVDYIARNLEVSMKGEKPPHKLTHFQFVGWPDFGVPASAQRLLEIISQVCAFQNLSIGSDDAAASVADVRSVKPNADFSETSNQPPLVVHCSAGIGRTGTFIAIDSCLRELNAAGTVDIQNALQRIRKQRAFCVQTAEQYSFCYVAVLEHCLKLKKDDEEICRKIEKCLQRYKKDSLYSD